MPAEKPTYTEELNRIHDRLDGMEKNQSGLTNAITSLTMRMERWFGNDETETSGKFQKAETEAAELRGKLNSHIDEFNTIKVSHYNLKFKVDRFAWVLFGLAIAGGGAAGKIVSLLFG